jgi:predicted lactoylglutathione lyase
MDAGLTLKTKEGDLVTLTSHSYFGVDAFMYDSNGVLQTDSRTVAVTQHQRDITLTSGSRFAFSVVGGLSEQELGDIDAIVRDMDEIISEMARGDMDGALDKALSMGGYDTVSTYAADMTYQTSYQMTSETLVETVTTLPDTEQKVDALVAKMADRLKGDEERYLDKAQTPIDQLFSRHMKDLTAHHSEHPSLYTAIENARDQVRDLIDQMTGTLFSV